MSYKKETWKCYLACLLCIVMFITSFQLIPWTINAYANVNELEQTVYAGEGYEVTFKVTSAWNGAFNADVTIKNTSDKEIDNWALGFAMPYEITNIWNGTVNYYEDGIYVIKNAVYNQDISVGKSVSFGFCANCTDEAELPNSFLMMTKKETLDIDEYKATFEVVSKWENAFNGEIILKNNSGESIEDWEIEFDYQEKIESFWTAQIVEKNDTHYVIKNSGYNSIIKPDEIVKIGFNVSGNYAMDSVTDIMVSQVVVDMDKLENDSDGDMLTNKEEFYVGTNPLARDTDGDGIDDGEELYYDLNPLIKDTDNDSIPDGGEDLDSDGLSVMQEIMYCTNNLREDTDYDSLTDYEELFLYGIDPLLKDTDGDGLDDFTEIKFDTLPLKADSDENGVADGDEKIEQTIVHEIACEEKKEITSISVTMAGTGDIKQTTTIEDIYGKDILSSNVVGLIGVPVEIKSSSSFDQATIAFTYNEELLGEVNEEDLRVMWYDEENNQYVIMDDETVIDTENNIVSYTTTHFSTYLVVDRRAWYDVWSNALSYRRQPPTSVIPTEYFDICYVIDRSGSMSGTRITTAKEAISKFVDAMYTYDRGALIDFQSSASVISSFTSSKDELKNALSSIYASGGTNVEKGLVAALDLFDGIDEDLDYSSNSKMIVLLCDGDVNYTEETLRRAKDNGIKIYPVLIGSTSGQLTLQKIADATGGTFYFATTAEEIRDAIFGVQQDTIGDIDTTDTDGDGLYDIYEIGGMIIPNGTYVYSDPLLADTDGDGLTDAEEMGVLENFDQQSFLKQIYLILKGFDNEVYAEYFNYRSYPSKADTDGDGLNDLLDDVPRNSIFHEFLIYETSDTDYKAKSCDLEKRPEDFQYADLSKSELKDLEWINWSDFFLSGKYSYMLSWKQLAWNLSSGKMTDVAIEMIDHFLYDGGSDYTNSVLTNKIHAHENSKAYVSKVTDVIDDLLEEYSGDVYKLYYSDDTRENSPMVKLMRERKIYNPYFNDKTNGLGICVDGLYGVKIEMTSYSYDEETKQFNYTLRFTYYDIFGLNYSDLTNGYGMGTEFGMLAGFRCWYILQHWDEYDGNYQPYFSYMSFEESFSGEL